MEMFGSCLNTKPPLQQTKNHQTKKNHTKCAYPEQSTPHKQNSNVPVGSCTDGRKLSMIGSSKHVQSLTLTTVLTEKILEVYEAPDNKRKINNKKKSKNTKNKKRRKENRKNGLCVPEQSTPHKQNITVPVGSCLDGSNLWIMIGSSKHVQSLTLTIHNQQRTLKL